MWRARSPATDELPIEPGLLLMRVVHRHERPEPVRADVAGDDQEIAWRDVWQEPVLITERNDSHALSLSASVASSGNTQPADRRSLRQGVAMTRHEPETLTTAGSQR